MPNHVRRRKAVSRRTAKPERRVSMPRPFPSSASAPRPGGWRRSRPSFPACRPTSIPGMAFVLVQHLAPDHKSILTDLIQRYTRMQVFEVEDGMEVQPNCAYIIPPNRDMALSERRAPAAGTRRPARPAPAHRLLLPLPGPGPARAGHRHRALGHRQRRHTGRARHQGRRRHGHGPGPRDPPSTTACRAAPSPPAWWTSCCRRQRCLPSSSPTSPRASASHGPARFRRSAGPENALKKIFVLLRDQTGHDFSQYKPSTVQRRIERRMAVQQVEAMDEYVKLSAATARRSWTPSFAIS